VTLGRKELEDPYSERSVVAKTGQARAGRGLVVTVCVETGAESEPEDDERGLCR
jgi:hypothetical protein